LPAIHLAAIPISYLLIEIVHKYTFVAITVVGARNNTLVAKVDDPL
jgi:hypothetical protein